MKIAICNETFEGWSHRDAFACAADLGYDGLEIAPFTLEPCALDITAEQCSEVSGLARACGLEIVGLHWLLAGTSGLHLTSADPEVRRSTADWLARLAEVCRELGGRILVLGSPAQRNLPPGMSGAEGHAHAAACLRDVLPALERHNVILALEPLGPEEGNFLLTAAEARELLAAIGSPHVRLHLDVKAMSTEAIPVPDIIRSAGPDLVHFHCNDPNRRGPGMGDVDFRPIVAALRDARYAGWLSVEVFDRSIDAETMARTSIEYLRSVLAAIAD